MVHKLTDVCIRSGLSATISVTKLPITSMLQDSVLITGLDPDCFYYVFTDDGGETYRATQEVDDLYIIPDRRLVGSINTPCVPQAGGQ